MDTLSKIFVRGRSGRRDKTPQRYAMQIGPAGTKSGREYLMERWAKRRRAKTSESSGTKRAVLGSGRMIR